MWNPLARFQRKRQLRELEDIAREVDFTPDVAFLEMKDFHYVFEYGDAMAERKLYREFLSDSVCLGTAFTVEDHYQMLINAAGHHPLILPTGRSHRKQQVLNPRQTPARIKGELHFARTQCLFELDTHRLNGIQFKRVQIIIDIPHRKQLKITDQHSGLYEIKLTGQLHAHIKAWAYIGIEDYWNTRLDGGYNFPAAKLTQPNGIYSKPFYYFEGK